MVGLGPDAVQLFGKAVVVRLLEPGDLLVELSGQLGLCPCARFAPRFFADLFGPLLRFGDERRFRRFCFFSGPRQLLGQPVFAFLLDPLEFRAERLR